MSANIKSKDLEYNSNLPPFLQRLHDQNAGRGDADRHERAVARPQRAKDPNEDDEPTVVDESGETLSKEDLEKLKRPNSIGITDTENVKGDIDPSAEPMASGAIPAGEHTGDSKRTDMTVTDGTALKKRKIVKVVGNEGDAGAGKQGTSAAAMKKAKKKTKPVKLAFDDDDAS